MTSILRALMALALVVTLAAGCATVSPTKSPEETPRVFAIGDSSVTVTAGADGSIETVVETQGLADEFYALMGGFARGAMNVLTGGLTGFGLGQSAPPPSDE